MEKLIKIKEASAYLGVNPETLRRWEKAGIITPIRIGARNDRRYNEAMLTNLLNKRICSGNQK